MAGLPIAVGVGDPSGHAILLIQSHYSHPCAVLRPRPTSINTNGESGERDRPTGEPTDLQREKDTRAACQLASTRVHRPSGYRSRWAPRAVTGCIPCSGEVIKYGH